MPFRDAPASLRHNGWYLDQTNSVLEWYHNGVKIGQASSAAVTFSGAVTNTGITTANAELRVANGFNIRVGGTEAFSGTAPTNTLVLKTGTAPTGTITTSSAIYSSSTILRKIVADNTDSAVG